MKNYLGQFECKLCLTTHLTEANYLAHTQGRRHKQNLAKRAFQESQDQTFIPLPKAKPIIRKTIKIGRPAYTLRKQRDPGTKQYSLLIQISYPKIKEGVQPRFRIMSAYEYGQDDERKDFQYASILFVFFSYKFIVFPYKIPSICCGTI